MDIAERLQELRKKSGYSQEQVAGMLGLSRQAVSKWESGQGKPEIDNIVKLTEIYHVSADYILLGTEKQTTVSVPEKKELSREYKKAFAIIAIVAATAIITVLFITALGLLAKFGL
ncbi:MAG: helix-turn-helix transcriptional regulator [Lachnospiraceae bacterium]|nr:helix-turn-helix transcriptional regulator [Lachnospiraceae bacterium]MBO5144211.1 helix-turn-helix transcriptional regulator [Lachnospiraceae bacterium]